MKTPGLLVVALFLLLYVLPLGYRSMHIPDETRYAEIPREMIVSGDWVVPHLNGLVYFEKPVMGYWLNALSMQVLGQNSFAVRLPSALASALAALAVFLLIRRSGGGTRAGLAGALGFLTSFEVFAVGVFAVLDSVFAACVTVCLASAFFALQSEDSRRRRGWLILAGGASGAAFLVKGFLGFAIPALVVIPFLLWQGRLRDGIRMVAIPVAVALVVVLPWAVAVGVRDFDFWRYFLWTEHLERFMSATGQQQHPRPLWFFVPVILLGFIPWTFLLPAAIRGLGWDGLRRPVVRFCICWLVFPFLLLSMSKGKLATYILPCYAPLAVLLATGVLEYLDSGRRRAFSRGAIVSAVFAGMLGLCLLVCQAAGFGFRPYGGSETWKWVVGISSLAFWVALALGAARANGAWRQVALYGLSPVALMFCAHFILPDSEKKNRVIPRELIASHAGGINADTVLIADADEAPAVCWFLKRNDIFVVEDRGELSYGLMRSASRDRFVPMDRLGEFIRRHTAAGREVVLIEEEADYRRWRCDLPSPREEDAREGFVFVAF